MGATCTPSGRRYAGPGAVMTSRPSRDSWRGGVTVAQASQAVGRLVDGVAVVAELRLRGQPRAVVADDRIDLRLSLSRW